MKIQTNTAANSALGYMRVNNQNTERSIQKLSSGFRINRAADDAAGLAIANQLRADSKTLGQAQKNAAQASAMLQIADGAASTLGNIFDRMRELASQGASANIGAAANAQKLQDEWNALYSEADRLIGGTKYQGTNVMKGLNDDRVAGTTSGLAAGANVASSTASASMVNGTYTLKDSTTDNKLELWLGSEKVATSNAVVGNGAQTVSFDNGFSLTTSASFTGKITAAVTAAAGTVSGFTATSAVTGVTNGTNNVSQNGDFRVTVSGGNIQMQKRDAAGTYQNFGASVAGSGVTSSSTSVTVAGFTFALSSPAAGGTDLNNMTFSVSGATQAFSVGASNTDAKTFTVAGQTGTAAPQILVGTSASQGGSTYAKADSISLNLGSLDDIRIKNLSNQVQTGVGAASAGVDLTTTAGAQDALTRLDSALGALNTFVGKLGAAQSRVDYATQNVNSMLQNTQAAESSIRDADMAAEMTTFTKNNILQQAAQSMLSQANQGTQGILQLLRG